MGYGDFGRFNNGYVETPALDQLIDDGTCLTQHYAGSAVCSPSRAALLTGRYPIRTGAITPQEVLGMDRIALGETTIADHFKSSGYATGMVAHLILGFILTPADSMSLPASAVAGPTTTSGDLTVTASSRCRMAGI